MKTCSKCHTEKGEGEFYIDKNRSDGKSSRCKKCVIDCARQSQASNTDFRREYLKEYSRLNQEAIKKYKQKYQTKNREKINARSKNNRSHNNRIEYERRYAKNNREKFAEWSSRYYYNNRDSCIRKPIDNLTNSYITNVLKGCGMPKYLIDQYPELIEIKRTSIKTKRTLKNYTL